MMKILNEKPSNDIIMEFEMSDEERETLLKYGRENVDDETLINFAIVDMLKNSIARLENASEEEVEALKTDLED